MKTDNKAGLNTLTLHCQTESDLQNVAAKIAKQAKRGDCFGLSGPLGVGKTSFARGFIRSLLGVSIEVTSPTYTLVQTYEAADFEIWHYDLYRLENEAEVYETGLEEFFSKSVSLIEWPERLGSLKPDPFILIEFSFRSSDSHFDKESRPPREKDTERVITLTSSCPRWEKIL